METIAELKEKLQKAELLQKQKEWEEYLNKQSAI